LKILLAIYLALTAWKVCRAETILKMIDSLCFTTNEQMRRQIRGFNKQMSEKEQLIDQKTIHKLSFFEHNLKQTQDRPIGKFRKIS
jgi:hypothetical protein